MDGPRFDELTRALGAQRSRRAVLGALAGAALASVGLRADAEANSAKKCRAVGNSCNGNGNCCSGACVKESRTRKICHCASAADCPAATNPCYSPVCLPSGSCATAINQGAACDDGNACTTGDVCQSDGSCQGVPVTCNPPINACFTAVACDPAFGNCPPSAYLGDQQPCPGGVCFNQTCCVPEDRAVTCADGACGVKTNNCGQSVQCLTLAGDACAQDGDCCSGVCVNDKCQAGPVATGGACDSNGDCASHNCCSNVCIDISSDPLNCGVCGAACSSNGMATVTCSGGVCDGTCGDLYLDCNGDKRDGCEVYSYVNVDNCGGCGVVCSSDHVAMRLCTYGFCYPACEAGYANCDTPGATNNGCPVNLMADPANCGACGNVCTSTQYCANGACLAQAANGHACAFGGGCQSGHCCYGTCVDVSADIRNCGACGSFCFQGKQCVAGSCGCPAGDTYCSFGRSDPRNGCYDVANDPNHCGSCGGICPDGGGICTNGSCGCPGGTTLCNPPYACIDTQTDAANCGGCGNVCPAGNICVNGYCVCDAQSCCPASETYCLAHFGTPAGCTDTQTDLHNCGGCTTTPNGQLDLNAKDCSLSNQTCCGGACVDTLNDAHNCGACGHQCPTGGLYTGACSLGVCATVGCPAGYGNCDGNASNGCEANLSNDVNNCGACGNVCPGQSGGAVCRNGSCCVGHNGTCGAGGLGCCGGNNCGPFNAFTC